MSRGIVVKITELGCQSLVRGSAPRVLLFVKKCGVHGTIWNDTGWVSEIRYVTPGGLGAVFAIYCGWKRGRALAKCANSLNFDRATKGLY